MDPNDWTLTGNAGINPSTNFLGTTDNEPLVIKTNGKEALRINPGGNVGIGMTTPPHRLSVAANFDGDGIELIGSQSQTKDVGVALVDEVGNVGNLGLASAPSAFMTGVSPGDIVLQSVKGNVWLGSGPATARPTMGIFSNGNVGIGTTSPADLLHIYNNGAAYLRTEANNGAGAFRAFEIGTGSDFSFHIYDQTGNADRLFIHWATGNVGIGTASPSSKLTVSGAETAPSGDGAAIQLTNSASGGTDWYLRVGATGTDTPVGGFSIANVERYCLTITRDGTVSTRDGNLIVGGKVTVGGDIILTGADCAEEFEMAEAAEIEPGTVVVLDQDGVLHQSQQAYDKRVAGVISGAGDYKPGLILDRRQSEDYRVPIALMGKVYCKVDAQYAPIEVGDLLTTSPTLGHAMKVDDPLMAFGAVIGKALDGLSSGQGLVRILIALQ